MKTIRVFISSPDDVSEERAKARYVIESLERRYGEELELVPVLWEDLAITASASFQEGIDRVLEEGHSIDIAVFILWSRMGSPIGEGARKADGEAYRSGTEREFDLMLGAHERSGGRKPVILAYTRDDNEAFSRKLDAKKADEEALEELLRQRKKVKEFIREKFHDAQGRNLRAYHTYHEPVSFAQRLRAHLKEVLDGMVGLDGPVRQWEETPYPGLRVFSVDEAEIFFGREEETFALLNRLRDREGSGCNFACLIGPSGSGKSSLARAGVGAALRECSFDEKVHSWRVADLVLGGNAADMLAGLTSALAIALPSLGQGESLAKLQRFATAGNFEAVEILLQSAFRDEDQAAGGRVHALLILDQMESLWSGSDMTPEQREIFMATIEALSRMDRVAVLATLRSDFYAAAQSSPAFLRMKGAEGHFDLAPPGPAALRALISQPARRAGLRFERGSEGAPPLDEVILADALDNADALPLLQFALSELYARRDEKSHMLSFAAYREMGGVEGALARRAAKALEGLDADSQGALEEIIPMLVSVDSGKDGRRKPVRRRASTAQLATTSGRRRLLDALIRARLLVASESGGEPAMTLAHEALLERWPAVTQWISDNRQMLAMRARVEQCHAMWEESGRDTSRLLAPGGELREGAALLAQSRGTLPDGVAEFVRVSLAVASLRRRRRLAMAAAAIIILCGSILLWWNHARLRTEHYAFLGEKFGVPSGIVAIGPEAAARRNSSYVFESSHGKVRGVSHVNGHGVPVADSAAPFRAAVRRALYREDGTLQTLVFENAAGAVLARCQMSQLRPLPNGTLQAEAKFERESGVPLGAEANTIDTRQVTGASSRSEETAHRLIFSKAGHILRRINVNSYFVPRSDLLGSWGDEYTYDGGGLQKTRTSLAIDAGKLRPCPDKTGVETEERMHDGEGNTTEVKFTGTTGRPVMSEEGYAKRSSVFDDHGNETERRFFGADGLPTLHTDGYAKWKAKFNERGNMVEIAFFGQDGRPAFHTQGYAAWNSLFDDRGNETERRFFGADGLPTLHTDGYAKWKASYDERGNQTEIAFFGPDGKPVMHRDGYARKLLKLDEKGREVECSFFDTAGRPAALGEGFANWRASYDERGNQTEIAFFGPDGKPAHKNGYTKVEFKYDERGNRTENIFFAPNGRAATLRNVWFVFENAHCAKWVSRYDEQGNVTGCSFFVDGKPGQSTDFWSSWTAEYNEFGNKTAEAFFGLDGHPVTIGYGCARWTAKYDERGNQTELSFFGLDGNLAVIRDGYAKVSRKFDGRGNVIEENYFGADEKPIARSPGYAEWTAKYDERGNRVEYAWFGVDGSPVSHPDGWASIVSTFDERGNHTAERFFDIHGRPVTIAYGCASWTAKYDERGNLIERAFFDLDGHPAKTSEGFSKFTARYDEKGQRAEIEYFDAEGRKLAKRL